MKVLLVLLLSFFLGTVIGIIAFLPDKHVYLRTFATILLTTGWAALVAKKLQC